MAHLAAVPDGRRTVSPASTIYHLPPDFSSDSDSDSDSDDDDAPLPFPAALPRSDFLVPDFDPAAYLSALPIRHQTLEDLRSDLRDRSATISSELIELVNSNYTAFLSLGSELKGGDEKVGDVKVALLGFRRVVEEIKAKVAKRREDSRQLNGELQVVRRCIEEGRRLLELDDRLVMLEKRLAVESLPRGSGEGRDSDSSGDEEDSDSDSAKGMLAASPTKLRQSAVQCVKAIILKETLDQDHPLVIKFEERLTRCRNTLLLDLGNALKEARGAGVGGHDRVLKYLAIYRMLDAQREAVRSLKGG